MQYFDPFPVTCEHCRHRDLYPLQPLEAGKSRCLACGGLLQETPRMMRHQRRKQAVELWPHLLFFELACELDLDLDRISDEEAEFACLGQMLAVIQRQQPAVTSRELLAHAMLAEIPVTMTEEEWLKCPLTELAQWACPPDKA